MRHILLSLIFVPAVAIFSHIHAQLGFQPDITKPKLYENRILKAEKTDDKKLKASKRFFQNLTTHYNYYFNARNKLNEVIDRAKSYYKDDYTSLLPFYNYSLDVTAQDKFQLDSVIYKSRTGIVTHDLRNDWMDNLYLLWGAAYFFEKKFDSAALMFQFINYSFAEKEKDGYYKYIGSRMDGNDAISISTKEDGRFPKNLVTPPSRNDAFMWRIRTLLESGNLTEAGSLIATLKNDPAFPKRLKDQLEELQSYFFYKQEIWDSAAMHLVNGLDLAVNRQERARWEYLAAQMYEKKGKQEAAEKLYTSALSHATDPVLDIYTRLNLVRINKAGGENYVDKNIDELIKMAKKDKYEDYRDVIYFMAAQIEMERNHMTAAEEYLLKGAKYASGNVRSKNNAFLLIADLSFNKKNYLRAASFYDSIQLRALDSTAARRVAERRIELTKIVFNSAVISRQDSLQKIAGMPEQERTVFITRLLKQLKKQSGLVDEAISSGRGFTVNSPPNMFNNDTRGEWYFYNTALKTAGVTDFKQNWGNRPNVDNWRRFADVNQQLLSKTPNNTRPDQTMVPVPVDKSPSFNSLLDNLPLTDVKMQASNDSIRNALLNLGTAFLNELEDYVSAAETFEILRSRFPSYKKMDEVLFDLYYAYEKSGNIGKAAEIKKLLLEKYPASRLSTIANTGRDPGFIAKVSPQATKDYEAVYDMFLEGKFNEAEMAKKNADSIYHTNYWQPQLLYIESVYYIRRREDSVAKKILQTLIGQNTTSPIGKKAQNLLQVLNRRQQIEDELTRLQIQRPPEDSDIVMTTPPVIKNILVQDTSNMLPPLVKRDKDAINERQKNNVIINSLPGVTKDSANNKTLVKKIIPTVYQFDPAQNHYAMIVLNKVDPMFVNEAKNAFNRYNQEKYYNQAIPISIQDLDSVHKIMLIGNFANAQAAVDWTMQAKKLAANEIVPWLKPDKYAFFIMTDWNLEVLRNKKDLGQYRKFLELNLPGKF